MPIVSSLIQKRKNIMINLDPNKKDKDPKTGPEMQTKIINTNSMMTSLECSSDKDPYIIIEEEAVILARNHFLIQLHLYIWREFSTKKQSVTTTATRIQHLLPFYHFLHHLHISPSLPIKAKLLNFAF